jgi:hypothetical protein
MATRPRRPRDPNQLAKLIVALSTGEATDQDPNAGKDPAAIERGRAGGLKGGRARATALPAKERKRIAKQAASARWRRKKDV